MLEIAVAAAFVLIEQNDPITLERQVGFGIAQEGNALILTCRPGKNEIDIRLIPGRYQGSPPKILFWAPRADSRFGNQAKPNLFAWDFGETSINYVGTGLKPNRSKAEFIDNITRNDTLHIRFEAEPGRTETISFSFSVDAAELKKFVVLCEPTKVIESLRKIGSPIAP